MLEEIISIQKDLTLIQLQLEELKERFEENELKYLDIDTSPKLETIPNGLKITLPEYPPKTTIYNKVQFKDGVFMSRAYINVRNRWYSLIKKALKDYNGPRIDPAFVYIIYYVPGKCDADNFTTKFIIDGLMYAGAIAMDDNFKHVPDIAQGVRIDRENPRTEVYVLKHRNQIMKALITALMETRM
ncbi:MAG: hypothetical protein PWP21_1524 [Thermosediminibacterales bacterium]|nr:hypothetical protein [Thermosediminibacterales bacterium]